MSMYIRRRTGGDIELGPTMSVLKAFAEIASVGPEETYLYGAVHYGDSDVPDRTLRLVQKEAWEILEQHKLSPFATNMLKAIVAAKVRPPKRLGAKKATRTRRRGRK